jgi:hypothetical protein
MLVDASINWTLIGHSERRTLFKDTSELVAKKTAAALSQGLKVVLCIGETLEERDADKTMTICEGMTGAVVEAIKEEDWKNVVIAYEPGPSPPSTLSSSVHPSDPRHSPAQSGPSAPARLPPRSRLRTSTPSSASSSPPRSRRRSPTRFASSSTCFLGVLLSTLSSTHLLLSFAAAAPSRPPTRSSSPASPTSTDSSSAAPRSSPSLPTSATRASRASRKSRRTQLLPKEITNCSPLPTSREIIAGTFGRRRSGSRFRPWMLLPVAARALLQVREARSRLWEDKQKVMG